MSKFKKQDNICVRIGHETKEQLKQLAYLNEMSIAEYVRLLIREEIKNNEMKGDKNGK